MLLMHRLWCKKYFTCCIKNCEFQNKGMETYSPNQFSGCGEFTVKCGDLNCKFEVKIFCYTRLFKFTDV